MADSPFAHSEAFLQWIWENLLFDFTHLHTNCGKKITLLNPGALNNSNGPDFKQAAIEIDGITWHGDVELHTAAKNWMLHGHQHDENYNSVILHVVADYHPKPVRCQNNNRPYTLNLLPYLSRDLSAFLNSFENPKSLPCASGLHFISDDAFNQQIEKAHKEYFEKKASDFLHFYDAETVISAAWKRALIISLWDGLGISHNRGAMQQVASELLLKLPATLTEGLDKAFDIAGFSQITGSLSLQWNIKSVRPANHPKKRIEQAVRLTYQIMHQSFPDFLKPQSTELWELWIHQAALKNTAHFQILFGTVFLPSLYVLGNLLAHTALTDAAYTKWISLKTPIPASLLSKFKCLDLKDGNYKTKLGAVHQLKHYCKAGNCSQCFVLKKAILS